MAPRIDAFFPSPIPTAVRLTMTRAHERGWRGHGATWLAGAAMTVCALLDRVTGLVVSSVVLFPLLIAWTVWMPLFWRRA